MDQLLALFERDRQMCVSEMAGALGRTEQEIEKALEELAEKKIYLGNHAIIDWAKTDEERVTAWVELSVTPKKGKGFDEIAMDIARRKEVKSVYLMSGKYDLAVTVEEKSIKEISRFVFEVLATMEGVVSTSSHFMMRVYKEQGVLFDGYKADARKVDLA